MPLKLKSPWYPPPFIYKSFENFRYSLVRFSRRLTISGVAIFDKVQSFYTAKAIGVAANLNIAELLKNGALPISTLAEQTGTHEESLYRLMRLLASQGIFKEKKNRIFAQNRLSKTLLDQQESMRHMIIHQVNTVNWKLFDELEYSVRTGIPAATKVIGTDIFKYMEENPEKNALYKSAMSNTSMMLSFAVTSVYSFKGKKCIVDIGGGEGVLLSVILCKNKQCTGKVFDLPHVVNGAAATIKKYGLEDRMEMVPGSFYDSIPENGDVYLMKNILHFMGDQDCIDLLVKIKNAMSVKSKIVIIEPIIENNNRYSFAKLYDIQMLLGCTNGKERTKIEYNNLAQKSGLKLNRIIRTVSPFSLIELQHLP